MRWLALFILLYPAIAAAQLGMVDRSKDSGKPIDITADNLTMKPKESLAVFEGNVQAEQGDFHLKADRMDVHYHDEDTKQKGQDSLSKVVASGNVILTVPGREAHADNGVYDVDKGQVDLTGHVVLIRDKNRLEGATFTYNTASGESKLLNSKANTSTSTPSTPGTPVQKDGSGRVRGFFVPKGKQ